MLHAKMWAVIGSSFATGGVWDVRSRGMGGRGARLEWEMRRDGGGVACCVGWCSVRWRLGREDGNPSVVITLLEVGLG